MKARLINFDLALPPVHFELLEPSLFTRWIKTLATGFEAASGHRSAAKSLWTDYRQASGAWDDHVSSVFQGLKKEMAAEVASGRVKKSGRRKKPMEFAFYCETARAFWRFKPEERGRTKREERCFGFNILFMILCWNLMSRAKNVAKHRTE